MQTTLVSDLFSVLDRSALLIKNKGRISYLEALCKAGQDIYNDKISETDLIDRLRPLYDSFFHEQMTAEDVRRAFQLAALKGMKADPKPGHDMTPDTLVILIGHMVMLLAGEKPFSILDPAVGTANLLTGILNQAKTDHVEAYGADTDDLLIKLAYTNANLQQKDIHLFHQDGLKPILAEPADFAVCDVPVGFYPDQETAESYELNAINGKAYTHFLFIEQGLNHLKEAGYLLYLIPNRLFADDKDHRFHDYLQKNAVVRALLQLPMALFKDEKAAKSILLLQKKGKGVTNRGQALLAEMPDFMNEVAMRGFMGQLDRWFTSRSV